MEREQWYEGWLYKQFISPFLAEIRAIIHSLIKHDATVIDIGSGTGELAFLLAKTCKRVTGIEHSKRMMEIAKNQIDEYNQEKINFVLDDALNFMKTPGEKYDVAVFSFSLHEMDNKTRVELLKSAHDITDEIIVADFAQPSLENAFGIFNTITESLSNMTHFSRYVDFLYRGGISSMLEKTGWSILEKKFTKDKRLIVERAKSMKK